MPKRIAKTKTFSLYGYDWNGNGDAEAVLNLERVLIQHGGKWKDNDGKEYGNGLFFHYKRFQQLVWPEYDHHRWSDLILSTILNERITVVAGPKDTGKTNVALARFGLTDYFCFPDNTLILMSSTDVRGLELRVWGEVKLLLGLAKERFPWLPGKAVDHLHGVFTDDLGENCDIRDMRRGIICIPTRGSGGEWKGLANYAGIKQRRRRLLGDEIQFMEESYLTSIEHMDKGDFKGTFCGNPIGNNDPLDKMSEPEAGWGTEPDSEKTEVWRNKWGGVTINLDGRDSPNNDDPPNRYPYLIGSKDIERTANRCGKDSMEYWTQVIGKRKPGLWSNRVLTRQMCENFGAFEPALWSGNKTTKVYAIDAAYGGDRCVGGSAEFGYDVNGQLVLAFNAPVIIPIKVINEIPEDQIANFVRNDCEQQGILASNVFFDSTGRGSLGTSFGRLWSAYVNPVEFGGRATTRPVCDDMYIYDDTTHSRRLKRCEEHYSKLVTEFWFSVRYAVESKQVRNFPVEVAQEFELREWYLVKGDKRELETKEDTKERMGKSPDYADWASIIVEGARRLGFSIRRMDMKDIVTPSDNWKRLLRERARKLKEAHQLNYAA